MRAAAPLVVVLLLLPRPALADGGTLVEPVEPGRAATLESGQAFALGERVLAAATPSSATVYVRLFADVTASLRHRVQGEEALGTEIDARIAARRRVGPLTLLANARVGQGIGTRDDVDVEGSGLALASVASGLAFGAEARVRGELVDRVTTPEDGGRPIDVTAGAAVAADVGEILVRALGGWQVPRGFLPPGPTALVTATLPF